MALLEHVKPVKKLGAQSDAESDYTVGKKADRVFSEPRVMTSE